MELNFSVYKFAYIYFSQKQLPELSRNVCFLRVTKVKNPLEATHLRAKTMNCALKSFVYSV